MSALYWCPACRRRIPREWNGKYLTSICGSTGKTVRMRKSRAKR